MCKIEELRLTLILTPALHCQSTVTFSLSSTHITIVANNRSFPYTSHSLWNQLPASLRQPHPSLSVSDSIPIRQ